LPIQKPWNLFLEFGPSGVPKDLTMLPTVYQDAFPSKGKTIGSQVKETPKKPLTITS
jgi:hypothetical protein